MVAAIGFIYGRQGYHLFLISSLAAAVCAKDLALTRGVIRMVRIICGKEKC
jgi:hypothetical protein